MLNNKNSQSDKIRLYLGTACGKTTATFGVLMRALSTGKSVTLVFFDKLEANSSEGKTLQYLASTYPDNHLGRLKYFYTGINRLNAGPKGSFRFYSSSNGILPTDKEEAKRGLALLTEGLINGDEIVIADELLDVARVGLIDFEAVKTLLSLRKDPTLLIMTGRKAPDWLVNEATTISTTVQLKHHGKADEGIDC